MRRLLTGCCCLLALLLGPVSAWALDASRTVDEYTLSHWSMEDGLPHNLIHHIAQDRDGYIWVGTWEGAARFNGLHFTRYESSTVPGVRIEGVRAIAAAGDGDVVLNLGRFEPGLIRFRQGQWSRLPGEAGTLAGVSCLKYGLHGELWIGTDSSLFRLDGQGRLDEVGAHPLLRGERVLAVLPLPGDEVLVGNRHGLFRIAGGQVSDWGRAIGLPETTVLGLAQSRQGGLLVGGSGGVWRVEDGQVTRISAQRAEAMLEDRDGNLWISTLDGLVRHSHGRVEILGERHGLKGRLAPSLFEDRDGLLWVGTTNGLFRISDGPVFGIDRSAGLRDGYVRTLVQKDDRSVWIGHPMGVDVWRNGRMEKVPLAGEGQGDPSVLSMALAGDGGLWLGTYDQGVLYLPPTDAGAMPVPVRIDDHRGLPSNHVRALLERGDGELWIGSNLGVSVYRDGRMLRHYGAGEGMPAGNVYALREDRHGVLWIGTSNGMAALDADGRVRAWLPGKGYPAVAAFDFHDDTDGNLWIASDRGLLKLRGDGFLHLDYRHGLPNDTLFRILDDGLGSFWITSNRGVFRISRAALAAMEKGHMQRLPVELFTQADGIPSSQANGASSPAGWRMRDGRLWFAMSEGLAVIDPNNARRQRGQQISLAIESLELDGQALPWASDYAIPASTRRLVIHFSGLNMRAPDKLRYRYRLHGFDADWIEMGSDASAGAVYTNLPPGELRFEVQAMNAPANWNERQHVQARTLTLQVTAPWWLRPWFLVLCALAVMAMGWVMAWLLTRRQRQQRRRLEQLIDSRTRELTAKNNELERASSEREDLLRQLAHQAHHDSLTRLANRRAGDEFLQRALQDYRREGRPLCVALMDIDRFKLINDRHGHGFGDEVLARIAEVAGQVMGEDAGVFTARYGGEEFLLCQQDVPWPAALQKLERLCREIAALSLVAPDGTTLACTVSMGVAELQPGQDARALMRVADERLYKAKQTGRDRIVAS